MLLFVDRLVVRKSSIPVIETSWRTFGHPLEANGPRWRRSTGAF